MNIDKMINMLLIKLSEKHNIFFMEMRTYKDTKIYKTYKLKIDNKKIDFKNKKNLLIYLSKIK